MTQPIPERARVLIVDDVSENIHLMMGILRKDYAIIAATSGARAIELARQQPQPDLILLDIKMPVMDGYETLSHLKQDPITAGIPVIFVTALAENADEARGLELGVKDFVSKPISAELLKARIRTQLELRRCQSEIRQLDVKTPRDANQIPTLLLVDDAPENLHGLIEVLKDDYRLVVANSGQKALEIVHTPNPPDLILLDVRMPEMDGYEVCRRIKAMPTVFSRIPIIFVTVAQEIEEKIRGFEAGAADYITKPFDIDEVRARVRTHVELFELRSSLEKQIALRTRLLNVSEEKYRILADYSPNWEYWLSPDGAYQYVSPASMNVCGYTPIEFFIDPQLMDKIIHPDSLAAWKSYANSGVDNVSSPKVFRIHTRDGEERWVEHVFRPAFNARGVNVGLRGSYRDVTQRIQAEKQLDFMTHRDQLTGLSNRVLFAEYLATAIRQGEHSGSRFALLFINLDNFKTINESLGHSIGDRVLIEAANRLRSQLPGVDANARIGGDEFHVIVDLRANTIGIDLIAQEIISVLGKPYHPETADLYVGASVGIAVFPDDGRDSETLLSNAAAALHKAKAQGRSSLCFFSPDMTRLTRARLTLESDLRRALEKEEFHMHYQPQFDLCDGRLVGLEALLRWTHPEKGNIPPGEFIALAEESGLIVPIGLWVLRRVCHQIREWTTAGIAPRNVAINVSAIQLAKPDFLQNLKEILGETGVAGEQIDLEITESCTMHNPDEVIQLLAAIRSLGVRISIDDFGTGYSSLGYLQRMQVNKLKIDIAFVRDMLNSVGSASIVKTIIAIGHSLGLEVVAEGVETQAQAEYLLMLECDTQQGYLMSYPLAPDDMTRLLAKAKASHP